MRWPRRSTSPPSRAASRSTRTTRTAAWTRSTTWRRCPTCHGRRSAGTKDPMTIVLQQVINGVVLGSLYVLVALGLTLIYGVLVQINFAHADVVTLGAFAAYFFMHLAGGSYLAGIAVALVAGGVLGWLINLSIFAPLRRQGS